MVVLFCLEVPIVPIELLVHIAKVSEMMCCKGWVGCLCCAVVHKHIEDDSEEEEIESRRLL